LRRKLSEHGCPDVASPPQQDYGDFIQRLTELFAAGADGSEPPWGEWIERVRHVVNPNLLPALGESARSRADWLLGHTNPDQPLALGLLSYAETHVDCPRRKEQIAALASAIRDYYEIAPAVSQRLCQSVATALDKTALVLRLSGGEGDVYAFEVYEFWRQGADAPEEYGLITLRLGGSHVDLAAVDDGALPRTPGLLSRRKVVDSLMQLLDGSDFDHGLEIVASPELMTRWEHAPEALENGQGISLGVRHPIVLRSVAGFEGPESQSRKIHWQCVCKRRFKPHARDCTGLTGNHLERLRAQGRVATLDACAQGADQLSRCTEVGLSVVVWLRRVPTGAQSALECLQAEFKSCKVSDLPGKLQKLRSQLGLDPADPRFRIGLLMDNPQRRRPRAPLHRDG